MEFWTGFSVALLGTVLGFILSDLWDLVRRNQPLLFILLIFIPIDILCFITVLTWLKSGQAFIAFLLAHLVGVILYLLAKYMIISLEKIRV